MRKTMMLAACLALGAPAALTVDVGVAHAGCGKSKRNGTIIGALAGGALGTIAKAGWGSVIGAAGGAVAGRAIARHKKC